MAEVKWIKLMVGMFDGMSFKRIKRARIGGEKFRDKLTAIWFELLDLAGKCNHNGAFIEPNGRPFTNIADLAAMIDRDEEELQLCMNFFVNEGMVTYVDDVYMLTNWGEYQNVDGLEKIREQTRKRVQNHRQRKKEALLQAPECNVTCNVTLTHGNETDKDKEIDIDKDIDNSVCIENALTQLETLHKTWNFPFPVYEALMQWVVYKAERGEPYSDKTLNTLLKLVNKYVQAYSAREVINLVETCMASGYKNIVFDRLDK